MTSRARTRQHLRPRRGIDLGQPAVQHLGAELGELTLQPRAYAGVGARELELVQDRPGVERRAADQDGHHSPAAAVVDDGPGPALELGNGGRLGDLEHVHQVVRDAAAVGDRQLRGADVHAPVDLHRVGVHDLAAQRLGEVQRQRTLPRRGRTDHRDDRRLDGDGHDG
jgi:hypothetical protein